MKIRFAEVRDIPGILSLLRQVGQAHHRGRPDIFREGAQKYDAPAGQALLGKTLYTAGCGHARAIGCYSVTFNVWDCNPGAIAFYRAMGIQPQKTGMETIVC